MLLHQRPVRTDSPADLVRPVAMHSGPIVKMGTLRQHDPRYSIGARANPMASRSRQQKNPRSFPGAGFSIFLRDRLGHGIPASIAGLLGPAEPLRASPFDIRRRGDDSVGAARADPGFGASQHHHGTRSPLGSATETASLEEGSRKCDGEFQNDNPRHVLTHATANLLAEKEG